MTALVTIGAATLYCGDAYQIRPTLGWFDADVMDPPYRFDNSGGGAFRKARGHFDQIEEEGLTEGFDHVIINPLLCGAAVVFCHNNQVPKLSTYLDGMFEKLVTCMWLKTNPMPVANKHYQPDSEIYFHAWSRGFHPQGALADKKRHVIATAGKRATYDHATVKPDAVMDKILRNVAGERICDPFMGTGSSGVAAIKAGKQFVGIEHNPAHFETACARIRMAVQGSEVV